MTYLKNYTRQSREENAFFIILAEYFALKNPKIAMRIIYLIN